MKKLSEKKLSDEQVKNVTGGVIVDGGDKYWLVRQNGTVISPAPSLEQAKAFIKAYGESPRVINLDEYRSLYGKDLKW